MRILLDEDMKNLHVGLSAQTWCILRVEAKIRGITVQELVRAVIIGKWIENIEI